MNFVDCSDPESWTAHRLDLIRSQLAEGHQVMVDCVSWEDAEQLASKLSSTDLTSVKFRYQVVMDGSKFQNLPQVAQG